ncbi:hypothetical protein D3C73_1524590 [compost metagenome]
MNNDWLYRTPNLFKLSATADISNTRANTSRGSCVWDSEHTVNAAALNHAVSRARDVASSALVPVTLAVTSPARVTAVVVVGL